MTASNKRVLVLVAWVAVLAGSALPEILSTGRYPVAPLHWVSIIKAMALTALWSVSMTVPRWRPLRALFALLLCLHLSSALFGALVSTSAWKAFVQSVDSPFLQIMLNTQSVRVGIACASTFVLFGMFQSRDAIFLRAGNFRAPVQGLGRGGASWLSVGLLLTIVLSIGTLTFMHFGMRAYHPKLVHALPFLPLIVLFAATNSLGEELSYRLGILRPAMDAVGKNMATAMSAVYFGLAHYNGIPSGPLGVIMAAILGAIACRAIIDSKGIGWAVIIHFMQDIWIYSYLAAVYAAR